MRLCVTRIISGPLFTPLLTKCQPHWSCSSGKRSGSSSIDLCSFPYYAQSVVILSLLMGCPPFSQMPHSLQLLILWESHSAKCHPWPPYLNLHLSPTVIFSVTLLSFLHNIAHYLSISSLMFIVFFSFLLLDCIFHLCISKIPHCARHIVSNRSTIVWWMNEWQTLALGKGQISFTWFRMFAKNVWISRESSILIQRNWFIFIKF